MDLVLLDKSTVRIKGKRTSLIIDPDDKTPKSPADAILLLNKTGALERVEGFRLVVDDDGEYEVGGLKVTGTSSGSDIIYDINVDGTQVVLAKTSTLEKLTDTSNEAQVALLNVDSLLNESIIASLEAKAIVLYGERAGEGLKALGKHDLSSSKKFSVGKEKLPEENETQIVWLA